MGGVGGYIYLNRGAQEKCVYDAVRAERLLIRADDGTRPYYETQGPAEVLSTVKTFVELVATGEVDATGSQGIYTSLRGVLDACKVDYRTASST